MILRCSLFLAVLTCVAVLPVPALVAQGSEAAPARWSAQQANDWYAKQPWLVGANYIPSDAINQLEMFQAATFNPS